ncbi:MAG: NPCBM/NEW2 domain-containing protein [Phycisphaerales bacterium]|nr:NPCBM/NEW2 domain-containing protein [Phycisphaerales bacterium]
MHRAKFLLVLGLLSIFPLSGCESTGAERLRPSGPSVASDSTPSRAVWLDELNIDAIQQGWSSAKARQSVDGNPLTIAGRVYPRGVGSHSNAELTISLHGEAESFHTDVGLDDECQKLGTAGFIVLVDDIEVTRTGMMRGGDAPKSIHVDLQRANTLTLLIEDGGDNVDYDHADLAGAMIIMRHGSHAPLKILTTADEPLTDIARGDPLYPVINAPRITGATTGREFLFRIPASGERPMFFEAVGLPEGLTLDADAGIVRGRLAHDGRAEVTLTATNQHGVARANLTIEGCDDCLALTPPMGWNSWNVWGTAVDAEKVRDAADWLIRSGLADHGYQYINIDDAWEAGRDELGRIECNEKFQDMRELADYMHSRGLKLGIYSSPGPKTCASYEGSHEHELLDARRYAAWGIDLLKYDWCSYGGVADDASLAELRKPYDVMRTALDAAGRDIVFSLCQYGMGDVWTWGEAVGGNYWRTTGDITDTWASLSTIGFGQAGNEQYAGPGHWNDPDMLIVGKVGWGPNIRDTRLTPNEQLTHMTLWSLLAAPLLIGCDLTQLDDFTLALLKNPEVIEINQDRLGRQAARISTQGRTEIWARPLANGTTAVGLFNRGRSPTEIRLDFDALNLHGPIAVRDLWRRRDLGEFVGSYNVTVARHGAAFIVLRPLWR